MDELRCHERQEVAWSASNRVENSHLPLRRRECAMLRFRQMKRYEISSPSTPTSTITLIWNATSLTGRPTEHDTPPRWRSGRCLRPGSRPRIPTCSDPSRVRLKLTASLTPFAVLAQQGTGMASVGAGALTAVFTVIKVVLLGRNLPSQPAGQRPEDGLQTASPFGSSQRR